MDSPDYSDSDESTCSSGNSSIDCPSSSIPIHPKFTDVGKRVIFTSAQDKKQKNGVLRYVGEPEFSKGLWCGVVLDQPTGKNNGSVRGIRYFTCEPNFGMFVPVNKVKLDANRRLRSRPNSQPSSRASSVERTGVVNGSSSTSNQPYTQRKNSSSSTSNSLGPSSKMGLSIQQDLVNRLTQPIKRPSQQQQQLHQNQKTGGTGGRRQPMKAFATKGTEEIPVKDNRKPLTPFRAGGMYKASSSDNLRSMKDKDKVGTGSSLKASQGMPAKKCSSERDLRNSGKSAKSNTSSSSTTKSKRKQNRVNSCSDLLSAGPSLSPSTSKVDLNEEPSTRKLSCDSHPYLSGFSWPRTSTPGNRDELTPDGCSSPDDTDDHISKTQKMPVSHGPLNNGFVETSVAPLHPTVNGGESITDGKGEGLATHTKQFFESEVSSPSLPHLGVQAPEIDHVHNKQFYRNRPSGSATLSLPLTNSLVTDGAHLLKQLIGPNQSLEGVSSESLISLFDQQVQQWHSLVADVEEKLEAEKAKSRKLDDQLNQRVLGTQKVQEAKILELARKHKKEIVTLHATYRQAAQDYTGHRGGSPSTTSV